MRKHCMASAGPLQVGPFVRLVDACLGAGYSGKEYIIPGHLQNGFMKLQGEGGQRVTCAHPTNVSSSIA